MLTDSRTLEDNVASVLSSHWEREIGKKANKNISTNCFQRTQREARVGLKVSHSPSL